MLSPSLQMYSSNLAQKAKELKKEKKISDTLLFQMLPPSVAQQLKQTKQVNMWCHLSLLLSVAQTLVLCLMFLQE
jgi:hypothetical protein